MITKKIEMVKYNPKWASHFSQERALIEKSLSGYIKAVHHIGSTSIAHMCAKPVIDILIEVINFSDIKIVENQLKMLGFSKLRRSIIPHWSYFTAKYRGEHKFHCHIYEVADPQVARHLRFRDFLRVHKKDAQTYADIKTELAIAYPTNIYRYLAGKNHCVATIDAKAKLWAERNAMWYDCHRQTRGMALSTWSQDEIGKAVEANFNVSLTHFPQYLSSIDLIRVPEFTRINNNLNHYDYNYVIDTHLRQESANEAVTQVIDYFYKQRRPFTWIIGPQDGPANLARLLERHQLQWRETWTAVYCDLDRLELMQGVTEMTVRQTTPQAISEALSSLRYHDVELPACLAQVAAIYTSDDPIKFYVGYKNNQLLFCQILVFYAQCVGIYPLMTVTNEGAKDHRLLENLLLKEIKQLGYHMAAKLIRPHLLADYQSRGFVECGIYQLYQSP